MTDAAVLESSAARQAARQISEFATEPLKPVANVPGNKPQYYRGALIKPK